MHATPENCNQRSEERGAPGDVRYQYSDKRLAPRYLRCEDQRQPAACLLHCACDQQGEGAIAATDIHNRLRLGAESR
jgi:hypothetical protein